METETPLHAMQPDRDQHNPSRHSPLPPSTLSSQPCTETGGHLQLGDVAEDALSRSPVVCQTHPLSTPLTGREKRLKDIEDALSGIMVSNETLHLSRSQTQTSRLTGLEQRLKDIENALAGRDIPSKTRPSSQTQTSASRTRLKAIEDALLEMKVSSEAIQTSVSTVRIPNLKRTSCSAPESPPKAKRRQLSPKLPVLSSPASSSESSTSSFASTATTLESVQSSPEPELIVTPLRKTRMRSRRSNHTRHNLPETVDSHFKEFFNQYPDFHFDPSAPVTAQFHSMCDIYKHRWGCRKQERDDAYTGYKNALTKTFNDIYGTDVHDPVSWQKLCAVLEINPIPESLRACRNAVLSTHVNLVDLVDTPNTRKSIRVFPSEQALSRYTILNKKFFPKENAYSSGLLRFLLRQILDPPPVDTHRH